MTNLANLPPLGQRVPPYVSQRLRDFAKGQTCTLQMPWCNHNPETTVLCHVRSFAGAGMAQKPHDFIAYHGCSECHRRENEAGWDDILQALIATQKRVYEHFGGLTP